MSFNNRHVIKKQVVELKLKSDKDSFYIQNMVSQICNRSVNSIIEKCCDKVSEPGEIHRIQKLELDLGIIDLMNLEGDLTNKIKEKLTEVLVLKIGEYHQSFFRDEKSIPAFARTSFETRQEPVLDKIGDVRGEYNETNSVIRGQRSSSSKDVFSVEKEDLTTSSKKHQFFEKNESLEINNQVNTDTLFESSYLSKNSIDEEITTEIKIDEKTDSLKLEKSEVSGEAKKTEIVTSRKSKFQKEARIGEILDFFMSFGVLPWWAEQDTDILESMKIAIKKNPGFVKEFVKRLVMRQHQNQTAWKRFIYQFSNEILFQIFELLWSESLAQQVDKKNWFSNRLLSNSNFGDEILAFGARQESVLKKIGDVRGEHTEINSLNREQRSLSPQKFVLTEVENKNAVESGFRKNSNTDSLLNKESEKLKKLASLMKHWRGKQERLKNWSLIFSAVVLNPKLNFFDLTYGVLKNLGIETKVRAFDSKREKKQNLKKFGDSTVQSIDEKKTGDKADIFYKTALNSNRRKVEKNIDVSKSILHKDLSMTKLNSEYFLKHDPKNKDEKRQTNKFLSEQVNENNLNHLEQTRNIFNFDKFKNFNSSEVSYVENAGLILFWVYFQTFFKNLDDFLDTTTNKFISPDKAERAVLLMEYLVTNETEHPENKLMLNKILCGLSINEPIISIIDLSDKEKYECENLINAVINNWSALKSASYMWLKQMFLFRNGMLSIRDGNWLLQVETKAQDILLNKLPWTIGIIKLPWMEYPLFVNWRV